MMVCKGGVLLSVLSNTNGYTDMPVRQPLDGR